MELFGHQQRRGLSNGAEHQSTAGGRTGARYTGTADGRGDCVHSPAFSAVGARLGGARIEHHVTVGAAKPFGTRARVSVRGRTFARPSVQARFVGAAIVQVCNTQNVTRLSSGNGRAIVMLYTHHNNIIIIIITIILYV